MIQFLLGTSIIILVIVFVLYLWYCVSLSLILGRLGARRWKAFIPLYNISALISALKLPRKWFLLLLIPYVSTVYSVAVAYRLGEVYDKKFPFSAFWLTIAAPIGFMMLFFSKNQPDLKKLDSPPPSLTMIKAKLKKNKKDKQVTNSV